MIWRGNEKVKACMNAWAHHVAVRAGGLCLVRGASLLQGQRLLFFLEERLRVTIETILLFLHGTVAHFGNHGGELVAFLGAGVTMSTLEMELGDGKVPAVDSAMMQVIHSE
jgi:hypothetical protein